ncbi:unnamed protein product [Knipowitschia caucasica]|uniref:Mannan-binding lectin serine protease 1 n=1 Tax=Knipowitschia caucasica TaxID=637954 RepID=A0AAV2KE26_KNICA
MRLPTLFALLSLAAEGNVITLRSMYGSLESPNFPEPYPPNHQLVWELRVPHGLRIRLDFSHFHLEPSYLCEYDRVKVEAEAEVLGVFCGLVSSDTEMVPGSLSLVSPSWSMTVTFTSDFSNEERVSGFRAHYTAEDIDECLEQKEAPQCDHFCHNFIGGFYCSCRHGYQLHSDNRTCTVQCSDLVFHQSSGVLQSPDFPRFYPRSSDCQYQIQVQTGFRIRLDFDPVFDVEDHPEAKCPYDYVKVVSGSQVFGPFCGSVAPGPIQTESSSVTVKFHSDDSGENKGWSLKYSTTEVDCGPPPLVPNAQIVDGNKPAFGARVLYLCESRTSNQTIGTSKASNQTSNQTIGTSKASNQTSNQTIEVACGADGIWRTETGTDRPSCPSGCGVSRSLVWSRVKRIVGGRTAELGMFPWQVLIRVQDRTRVPDQTWFGSGSLLSESWVLTAAHILRSRRRDGTVAAVRAVDVQVFLGVKNTRRLHEAQQRTVGVVVLHPDFDPQNYNHDIALVWLSEAAHMNEVISPVCLPPIREESDPLQPHFLGVVSGWGLTSAASGPATDPTQDSTQDPTQDSTQDPTQYPTQDLVSLVQLQGVPSEQLQWVFLPVVSRAECEESYRSLSTAFTIGPHMFCAGFQEGGRDSCSGDSGGAYVGRGWGRGRWTVLGIVSWGAPEDCGSEKVYGVYTRVQPYVDWVYNETGLDPDQD